MAEQLLPLEFPDHLREFKRRVGIDYPDDYHRSIDNAVKAWTSLQRNIAILINHPADSLAKVTKENSGPAVASFQRFWESMPARHHTDMANAAGAVAATILNSWQVVLAFQKAMIDELAELKKYLDNNERYAWASFLPGVTDDGTRHKNAEEAIKKTKERLLEKRKKALTNIDEYTVLLDIAKEAFKRIVSDVRKREGFHYEFVGDLVELKPPKLGDWVES